MSDSIWNKDGKSFLGKESAKKTGGVAINRANLETAAALPGRFSASPEAENPSSALPKDAELLAKADFGNGSVAFLYNTQANELRLYMTGFSSPEVEARLQAFNWEQDGGLRYAVVGNGSTMAGQETAKRELRELSGQLSAPSPTR